MRADYPNLELIEYKFTLEIWDEIKKKRSEVGRRGWKPDFSVEAFVQSWPNTAGGLNRPGMFSGQMFISEFTTVIGAPELDTYAVFFGGKLGYLVQNPNCEFFNDLRDRKMKCVGDCHVYDKEEGVTH